MNAADSKPENPGYFWNTDHGILLGILGVKEEWYVSSNQESDEGYSDILVESENSETVILIEVKYANDGNLDQACERALQQIEEKKYDEALKLGSACGGATAFSEDLAEASMIQEVYKQLKVEEL